MKDVSIDELIEAFATLCLEDQQKAISVIAGLFVGVLEASIEQQGGDVADEIHIDGLKRTIIVGAIEKDSS